MPTLQFANLAQFAAFCSQRAAAADPLLSKAVGLAGEGIFLKARALFGDAAELKPSLAASTVTLRTKKQGYYKRPSVTSDPNATLLWTGGLRSSLEFFHAGLVAGVGSPDPVMQWQELGTARIPPRPLLRIASKDASAANWLVVRHYAAAMFTVNMPGGGSQYVASMSGANIANQFTGALKKNP